MTHLPTKLGPAADRVYWATHKWIRRKFDKTGSCEHCGVEKKTEWARRDHAINSRERADWMELCRSCHRRYDDKEFGRPARRLFWSDRCAADHEFTPENTYWYERDGRPQRRCRACHTIRAAQRRAAA